MYSIRDNLFEMVFLIEYKYDMHVSYLCSKINICEYFITKSLSIDLHFTL